MADLPTIEGFRVLEEIGSGAIASVFAAVEEPFGRRVAIKLLKSTIAPSSPFALQLEREARALSSLCHPNVGLLHSFRRSEALTYLVLEFVDGWSLAALLKRRSRLPHHAAVAIGAAVARGLEHAHDAGIVHCGDR